MLILSCLGPCRGISRSVKAFPAVASKLTDLPLLTFVHSTHSDSFPRNNRFECRVWLMRLSTDETPCSVVVFTNSFWRAHDSHLTYNSDARPGTLTNHRFRLCWSVSTWAPVLMIWMQSRVECVDALFCLTPKTQPNHIVSKSLGGFSFFNS